MPWCSWVISDPCRSAGASVAVRNRARSGYRSIFNRHDDEAGAGPHRAIIDRVGGCVFISALNVHRFAPSGRFKNIKE
jgi:hypothetical protein